MVAVGCGKEEPRRKCQPAEKSASQSLDNNSSYLERFLSLLSFTDIPKDWFEGKPPECVVDSLKALILTKIGQAKTRAEFLRKVSVFVAIDLVKCCDGIGPQSHTESYASKSLQFLWAYGGSEARLFLRRLFLSLQKGGSDTDLHRFIANLWAEKKAVEEVPVILKAIPDCDDSLALCTYDAVLSNLTGKKRFYALIGPEFAEDLEKSRIEEMQKALLNYWKYNKFPSSLLKKRR